MLTKDGERFQLELRSSRDAQVDALFPVLHLHLRQVGIELSYSEVRSSDREGRVLYPGLSYTGGVANSPAFGEQFHTRTTPRAENRFVGNNVGGYSNPELDSWQDELNRSARFDDVLRNWGEGWRVLSQDVATIPLFIRPSPYIVRAGIDGALPTSRAGSRVWQLHLWDVR
jgi:ABC-type oligopeptide transport system substrate-binding subunit